MFISCDELIDLKGRIKNLEEKRSSYRTVDGNYVIDQDYFNSLIAEYLGITLVERDNLAMQYGSLKFKKREAKNARLNRTK